MPSPLDISEQEIRERCASLLTAASDEATRLYHNYIGTEHLYNALTKVEGGITQRLLVSVGLDPRIIRNDIRRDAGTGEGPAPISRRGKFSDRVRAGDALHRPR